MISHMHFMDETHQSSAGTLCKSCGLCCTGHLFIWAKLRPSELDPADALGLTVFRSEPRERGFSQPCPLWHGQCTIYALPQYPHVCRAYQCKLLKKVISEDTTLPAALAMIRQAKEMIRELEARLPASPTPNFRERLVAFLEAPPPEEDQAMDLRRKAEFLLTFYEHVFGVDDLVEREAENGLV